MRSEQPRCIRVSHGAGLWARTAGAAPRPRKEASLGHGGSASDFSHLVPGSLPGRGAVMSGSPAGIDR